MDEKRYTNIEALAYCIENEGAVFLDNENFRIELRDGVPHLDGEKAVMAFEAKSGPFRLVKAGRLVGDEELKRWQEKLDKSPNRLVDLLADDKRTKSALMKTPGILGGAHAALRSVGLKLQIAGGRGVVKLMLAFYRFMFIAGSLLFGLGIATGDYGMAIVVGVCSLFWLYCASNEARGG